MADKDFVVKNGLIVGDTATINGVQIDPSGASSNQVLKFDGTKFAPAAEGDISGTSYSATIGDGTNSSYTVTHGFGTRNVVVVIRSATSPYEVINARWEATTTNAITVDFSAPLDSSSVVVTVYSTVTGVATGSVFYQNIGNASDSSFTLTHGFNTRDVVVTARNASSPYESINVRWEAETANTVVLDFSSPPSNESVRVAVYATVSGMQVTSTDEVPEGSTNLYLTNSRVRSAISVSGDLSYNSNTGVISFTDIGVSSITGTANEIEVSASNGPITIGLPANVTISQDLVVTGNLTVSGNTTTINTETLLIEDNSIVLNSGHTGSPTTNAGVMVERGTSTDVEIRWNETSDIWEFTNDGINYYPISNVSSNNTTFTGTITLPATTSIGNVSNTEIGYLDGVTSAIQTQLDTKASTGKAIAMAIVFGG